MAVARESVRHLQSGGALLVYATGRVDPDPALLPGSEEALQTWSASLSLFLQRVPEARLVPAIVRGVLAAACLTHPLTRLRREPRQKQFLAEFIQVGQQVLFGRGFGLRPTVHFARPLTSAELAGSPDARATIVARAQALLAGDPDGSDL